MISDVTPVNHEFTCYRFGDPNLNKVNYQNEYETKLEDIINFLENKLWKTDKQNK